MTARDYTPALIGAASTVLAALVGGAVMSRRRERQPPLDPSRIISPGRETPVQVWMITAREHALMVEDHKEGALEQWRNPMVLEGLALTYLSKQPATRAEIGALFVWSGTRWVADSRGGWFEWRQAGGIEPRPLKRSPATNWQWQPWVGLQNALAWA